MVTESVVVVTGASSGIGRAIAIKFAQAGFAVIAHGFRNISGLDQTQKLIGNVNVSADKSSSVREQAPVCKLLADVSLPSDCDRLVEEAFAWKGHVDVWVNTAGANVLTGESSKISFDEKLDLLWRTDVAGTIRLSRLVASRMQLQQQNVTLPSIVNISWDQAEHGMEGDSGQYFSATKAAIATFSKSLAKSVGPGVRVNCVAPGWIKTEWGNQASPEWDARARGESILNRWGSEQDIANVIFAISSPGCEFVNGQTIAVNGGWQPRSAILN